MDDPTAPFWGANPKNLSANVYRQMGVEVFAEAGTARARGDVVMGDKVTTAQDLRAYKTHMTTLATSLVQQGLDATFPDGTIGTYRQGQVTSIAKDPGNVYDMLNTMTNGHKNMYLNITYYPNWAPSAIKALPAAGTSNLPITLSNIPGAAAALPVTFYNPSFSNTTRAAGGKMIIPGASAGRELYDLKYSSRQYDEAKAFDVSLKKATDVYEGLSLDALTRHKGQTIVKTGRFYLDGAWINTALNTLATDYDTTQVATVPEWGPFQTFIAVIRAVWPLWVRDTTPAGPDTSHLTVTEVTDVSKYEANVVKTGVNKALKELRKQAFAAGPVGMVSSGP